VPATLYCNLGDVTNLAVAQGETCLFTRVSQFGIEGVAQRLAERRALTLEHSRQWLSHVGLVSPIEEIEGDPETVAAARDVLADGASKLADEVRLSVEYYGAQEGAFAVEGVVACGAGTTIPGLPEQIERELGLPLVAPRPEPLAHLDGSTAARLTLSYGLAMEA
jgi:type IV pilus assembly protein PilM